jgi:RNA 2',3'-cyclic 3'-phosphodiesterase
MASVEADSTKARLFFALWPPVDLQARLADVASDLQRELGGKATRADSIHLTLVFLGDVAAAQVEAVKALGESVRCEPFTLKLDTSGCWAHNRIAWVAPASTPQPLAGLAAELQTRVRALGFTIDERPYAAHITLVRKAARARRAAPLQPSVQWPVDDFVLVSSQLDTRGSRYSVIGRWRCNA